MVERIRKLYKSLQAPAKASLWFLICGFLQKGITLITTPLFTRIMTAAEYGRFSVYNSWFGIIQIITSLNLAAGVYTRGLVKNETDQERFTSAMLGLSTTCILIGSVIYAAFHNLINNWLGLSTVLMGTMMVEIWATAAYQFWSNRERANYQYKRLVALTLIFTILRPLMGLVGVLNAGESNQVEGRVICTTLVNVILFSGLYIAMMEKGKCFFDREYWRYALKFNIPLVPHYLSQIVLSQSDKIMIKEFVGAEEAAYYSVAYTLSMVLQILSTSISGTMNPWIYRSLEHGTAKRIGKPSYLILIIIAVSNLFVIIMAPEILTILAPESYQSAVWVIPPVTASVYFMFLYNLFATFEYYYNKTSYVMFASVIGAIMNVVLNAVFIPKFGYIAAGYTTLVCYIMYAFAHCFFMRKIVKDNLGDMMIYNYKLIVGIGAVLIVCSAAVMLVYDNPLLRYFMLICGVVIVFLKRKMIVGIFMDLKKR